MSKTSTKRVVTIASILLLNRLSSATAICLQRYTETYAYLVFFSTVIILHFIVRILVATWIFKQEKSHPWLWVFIALLDEALAIALYLLWRQSDGSRGREVTGQG